MNDFNPIVPQLNQQKHIICGFTTRKYGVSPPPFDSLNLGLKTSDNTLNIRNNHEIVYNYLGIDETQAAFMEQVHGDTVIVSETGGISPKTDGLITSKCGLMLGVKIADCIPLLLFEPVHNVIGAIHCGWRSIKANIAEKAIAKMVDELQASPENIVAVMGPSAESCCYEIGRDIAAHFNSSSLIERNGLLYLDLKAELRVHLLTGGLISSNIEIISDCTICNKELYFSHRRDNKKSGRMMGYIMVNKEL